LLLISAEYDRMDPERLWKHICYYGAVMNDLEEKETNV